MPSATVSAVVLATACSALLVLSPVGAGPPTRHVGALPPPAQQVAVAAEVEPVCRPSADAAALSPGIGTGAGSGGSAGTLTYGPPMPPIAVVTERFAAPPNPWGRGHRGVDLAAAPGATVLAPGDGVVTFCGTVVDRGVLTITHPDGLRSSLEPVAAATGTGTVVSAGEPVAVVAAGASHCSPRSCLHWGVRRGETYLDPLSLLGGGGPVVLLPVVELP